MTFAEYSERYRHLPGVKERVTDAYCLRLLDAKRKHDFDVGDLAEREERPVATIENCLQRAKEIELRKKQRGAL